MRLTRVVVGAAIIAAVSCGPPAQAATRRIFSYDPVDDATRRVAGALTFEFNQRLMSTRVLKVRATEGPATAELKPAAPNSLGRAGLTPFIGTQSAERDLYEILPADEGQAMMAAFCPGARRVWMAFGRLRTNQDLRIYVLGDGAPGGAGVRLCQTLRFTYHGEWRLPSGPPMDPNRLAEPQFPY